MRIQRDDSTNKIEKSETSLGEGETLKPRVAETEETRLDKSWPKLKEEMLKQRGMKAETKKSELLRIGRNLKEGILEKKG